MGSAFKEFIFIFNPWLTDVNWSWVNNEEIFLKALSIYSSDVLCYKPIPTINNKFISKFEKP